jgi:hypothetical protein
MLFLSSSVYSLVVYDVSQVHVLWSGSACTHQQSRCDWPSQFTGKFYCRRYDRIKFLMEFSPCTLVGDIHINVSSIWKDGTQGLHCYLVLSSNTLQARHSPYPIWSLHLSPSCVKTYSFCWPGKQNWVAFCQGKVEGGFRGRTNKLVDGCYSFWQVCPSHFSCSRWKKLFNLLDLYWRFVPWPQKSRELHWTILAGSVTMASKSST